MHRGTVVYLLWSVASDLVGKSHVGSCPNCNSLTPSEWKPLGHAVTGVLSLSHLAAGASVVRHVDHIGAVSIT